MSHGRGHPLLPANGGGKSRQCHAGTHTGRTAPIHDPPTTAQGKTLPYRCVVLRPQQTGPGHVDPLNANTFAGTIFRPQGVLPLPPLNNPRLSPNTPARRRRERHVGRLGTSHRRRHRNGQTLARADGDSAGALSSAALRRRQQHRFDVTSTGDGANFDVVTSAERST